MGQAGLQEVAGKETKEVQPGPLKVTNRRFGGEYQGGSKATVVLGPYVACLARLAAYKPVEHVDGLRVPSNFINCLLDIAKYR